jgi:CheY-like chemotaxis protein
METDDFPPRVLLVDDDPVMLEALSLTLEENGFSCRIASDGFEALRVLRQTPPDIIISDLRMPNMSGFELLAIVRRRFPQIAVIVTSGEFISLQNSALLMNAYFQKGEYTSTQLIATMRELHSHFPIRPPLPKQEHALVWVNRRSSEYLIATCTECLRSFPIETENTTSTGLKSAECPSCGAVITYAVDASFLLPPSVPTDNGKKPVVSDTGDDT